MTLGCVYAICRNSVQLYYTISGCRSGAVTSDVSMKRAVACLQLEEQSRYAIVETRTREEALDIARQFMDLHRIHIPDFECEGEVRPLEDM